MSVIFGTNLDDTLTGTDGNDTIYGKAGKDTLSGLGGNDRLYGNKGNDTLTGGSGNDFLFGGGGDDTIYGDTLFGNETGNDRLYGGAGNDLLFGGYGNDKIYGDEGNDSLNGYYGNDRLYGGSGDDNLAGSWGNDVVNGGSGNDYIDGAGGRRPSDTFNFTSSGAGRDGQGIAYAGSNDYALITDFNKNEDVIKLSRNHNSPFTSYTFTEVTYTLGAAPDGLPSGTGIYAQFANEPNAAPNLITILQGVSPDSLDLNASYFQYVRYS
jgi:Ca2+-binding RTX toxin-like protein